MSAENIRVSSTKGVIPTYTAVSGTLTTNGTTSTKLDYTGSVTVESLFGAQLQKALAGNIYVYENSSTNGSVRKVVGIQGSSTTWALVIESAFGSALSAEAVKLVTADLQEFSVTNDGGANGVLDGVAFVAGDTVTVTSGETRKGKQRLPKAFNATGTTYLITEFK